MHSENTSWRFGWRRLAALVPLWAACVTAWAQTDSFGYKMSSAVPYSYLDIAATGATVLSNADDGTATLALPFGFRFYGTVYNSLCVSSNGLISFGGCVANDFNSIDLTGQAPPGNLPLIAPFWSDLTFSTPGAGGVVYQTLGNPNTRQFVLQWNNVTNLNVPGNLNFQVILAEGTNHITFQYKTVESSSAAVSKGKSATVGIRGADGQTNGNRLQWSYHAPAVSNEMAIRFTAPPNDKTAPLLSFTLSPASLSPPNHKMVGVTATIQVSDETDPRPSVVLVSITSNEPDNGQGDGDTANDIQGAAFGTDDRAFELRAERSGTGNGRIYTVTYKATDAAGNTTQVSRQVVVGKGN